MNTIKKLAIPVLGAVMLAASAAPAFAVNDVPQVDLNQSPPQGSPWGGFKLVQCDGPDLSGLNYAIKVNLNGKTVTNTPTTYDQSGKILSPGKNPDGYVPCNFKGLMIQAQFLINVMIVLGVFAALVGFAYAGFLSITGVPSKIEQAKKMFPKIAWGFVIMLTGWFVVYQILQWLTGSTVYLQGTVQ